MRKNEDNSLPGGVIKIQPNDGKCGQNAQPGDGVSILFLGSTEVSPGKEKDNDDDDEVIDSGSMSPRVMMMIIMVKELIKNR